MSFCQNVRTALTRMAQKEAGRVRTEIREPQGPKDMQDESGRTVSATLCSQRRDVVRSGFAPGSARRGERLAKGQSVFARGRTPTRKKKPSEVLVSSFFPPSLKRLCGKTFSSLRQESFFMPQRNSIFAAKKRPSRRRNAPYRQFSRPVFNSSDFICDFPSRHGNAGQYGISCSLIGNSMYL